MRSLRRDVTALSVGLVWCGLLAGCGSEGVVYEADADVVRTQSFGATDLQMNVKNSVDKLVAKATRAYGAQAFAGRPLVFVAPVLNNTDQHIEPNMIQQFLESDFTDKANVRLVDRGKASAYAQKELRFQGGDLVDPKSAQEVGKFLGAAYFLYAELSSHRSVTRSRRAESQLYFFSLSLIKVETLEKIPVIHQYQKVAKRGWFGP